MCEYLHMTSQDIIQIIIDGRKQAKLTQLELAQRAGLSRRTIISLEAGEHDIGVRKLERLLNALGMHLTIARQPTRPVESELTATFRDEDEDE